MALYCSNAYFIYLEKFRNFGSFFKVHWFFITHFFCLYTDHSLHYGLPNNNIPSHILLIPTFFAQWIHSVPIFLEIIPWACLSLPILDSDMSIKEICLLCKPTEWLVMIMHHCFMTNSRFILSCFQLNRD